jgi:hypothetical protein
MITCDKGNVEMEGNLILLEAETIAILRGIRNTLEESCEKTCRRINAKNI